MSDTKDHLQELTEIRSMMERSSKFLSLSGWAGVFAGIYALTGAYIAYQVLQFRPQQLMSAEATPNGAGGILLLGIAVLVLAVGTAVLLSARKAQKRGEKIWNGTSRRLLLNMLVPLLTGGILILVSLSKSLTGMLVPLTLIFYGLSLFNVGAVTYRELRSLGIVQIVLGLLSFYYVQYGLLFWAAGFGIMHIIYGIYIHYRHER